MLNTKLLCQWIFIDASVYRIYRHLPNGLIPEEKDKVAPIFVSDQKKIISD